MVDQGPVLFLAGAQGLLGFLVVGDILYDGLKFAGFTLFLEKAADAVLMPDHALVRGMEPMVEGYDGLIRRQRIDVTERNGRVLFGERLKKVCPDKLLACFGVKAAEGIIHKGEFAVWLKSAD